MLILFVMLCAPAAIYFLGWGLYLIYEEAGVWVFLAACASFIVVFLGIALAIDEARQESFLQRLDQ